MRRILGLLVIVLGAALAVYVGIVVFFIGGITNIIDGAKATPTDAMQVVGGLFEAFVMPEVVGGIIFYGIAFLGILLFGWKRPKIFRSRSARGPARRSTGW